jgi:hypothetical protein
VGVKDVNPNMLLDAFVGRTYQRRPKTSQQQAQEERTPVVDNLKVSLNIEGFDN